LRKLFRLLSFRQFCAVDQALLKVFAFRRWQSGAPFKSTGGFDAPDKIVVRGLFKGQYLYKRARK